MSATTGAAVVSDHVIELVAVLALLYLCLGIGLTLLRAAGLGDMGRPAASLVAAVAVGAGAFGTAILAVGIAGLLRPWPLLLLAATAAGLARRGLADAPHLLKRCSELVVSRWDVLVFAFVGLVAAALLVQSSMPPTDWDSLVYHLEVPGAWLEAGEIHLPADNLHAAYTGLVHLLYVPLLAIGAESGPATVSAILACLLAVTLFEFGDRFFDRTTGRLAAATLFGSPMILFVAMTPRVDVTVTLFLVLGIYALYACHFEEASDPAARRRWLYLGAGLLGLATSVKLLAVPWVVAAAPFGLWVVHGRREHGPGAARILGLCIVAFLCGAAPGMLLRWHLTEAPMYPQLSARLIEPWLRAWFETSTLPPDLVLEGRALYTRDPVNLTALLTDPGSLTPEREGAFYVLSPILWLLPLAALRLKRPRVMWLIALAALHVGIVLLGTTEARTNLRYLIPGVVTLTLVASSVLSRSTESLRSGLAGRGIRAAFVVLAAAPACLPFVLRWSEMPTFGHLTGRVSEETYLTENGDPDVYHWAGTARWLDRRLSREDRVLLVFEGRGFQMETPHLQDNLMANWPLLAMRRESGDCLGRAGITHVVVNFGVLSNHMSHGMPATVVAWPKFPAFARECLRRLDVRSHYALYRVDSPAADGGRPTRTAGQVGRAP